jgi:hypothetical protein
MMALALMLGVLCLMPFTLYPTLPGKKQVSPFYFCVGFIPILDFVLGIRSANPLDQRWGVRPVAFCGMGG